MTPSPIDRRKFPRFDVFKRPDLTGHIEQGEGTELLATVAFGGCGFYALPSTKLLSYVGRQVTCVLQMKGITKAPTAIEGDILYASRTHVEGREYLYLGIRFVSNFEKVMQAIITAIEADPSSRKA